MADESSLTTYCFLNQLKNEERFEGEGYGGDSFRPRRDQNTKGNDKHHQNKQGLRGNELIKFQVSKLKQTIIRDNKCKMDQTIAKERYCSKETVKTNKKPFNSPGNQMGAHNYYRMKGSVEVGKSNAFEPKSTTSNLLYSKKRGSSLKELLSKVDQEHRGSLNNNRKEMLRNIISPKGKNTTSIQKDKILRNSLIDSKNELLFKTRKNQNDQNIGFLKKTKAENNSEHIENYKSRAHGIGLKKSIGGLPVNQRKNDEIVIKSNYQIDSMQKRRPKKYFNSVKAVAVKPVFGKEIFSKVSKAFDGYPSTHNTDRLRGSTGAKAGSKKRKSQFDLGIENIAIHRTHNSLKSHLKKSGNIISMGKAKMNSRSSKFIAKKSEKSEQSKNSQSRKRFNSSKTSKGRGSSQQRKDSKKRTKKKNNSYQLKTLNDFLSSSKANF